MKKPGLIFIALLCVFQLFTQQTINLFKSDLSVLNIGSSLVDSLKFSNSHLQLDIYKNDLSVAGINISTIDSLTFSGAIPQNKPAISNVTFSALLNTTVKCNFTVLSTGGTSVTEKGICWSTAENPTIENNKLVSTSTSSTSSVDISGLTAQTPYFVRAYAINATGISYSDQAAFTTPNYKLPSIEIVNTTFNYDTNINRCTVFVPSNGGCALTERGICWSTTQNPTTGNSKYSSGTSVGSFYANMTNLSLNTTYYVRPFATNCMGTFYGAQIKVQPLMGNMTFTLEIDKSVYPTQYNLIKTAMDSACWYYNRYTTFKGNIRVLYTPGVPTAQASYHWTIEFGSNTSYMWVGTAMHEVAHFVGSGTTTGWRNKLVNGVWTGTVANDLLKSWTGESLRGDNNSNPIHFWPYGINYKTEITNLGSQQNQQEALIRHAKLVKAMVIDDAKVPNSW
ncbi:MAG TPA: fibronectin type III domain-containing protein [Paludibacter sp.]|nr:fibronectin type III domain-containing protein [Paludibacter sp.]